MKLYKLSVVLASILAAPMHTAPTPEHLEVTLAVDSVAKSSSMTPPWEINLRFVGAVGEAPSDYYDETVKVDWKSFSISLYPILFMSPHPLSIKRDPLEIIVTLCSILSFFHPHAPLVLRHTTIVRCHSMSLTPSLLLRAS